MRIVRCDEEKNKKSAVNNYPFHQLPNDLIVYIMSYLPLSSLFSSRRVSKFWNTLFLHPDFSFLHERHTVFSGLDLDDVEDWQEMKSERGSKFTIISQSSQGLLLEVEETTTTATTYSMLANEWLAAYEWRKSEMYVDFAHAWKNIIDSPQVEKTTGSNNLRYRIRCPKLLQRLAIPNPQNHSLCIALEFVPSDQADAGVKLVSVYDDEQNHSLGYEILAIGIGSAQSSYCWRVVKVPPPTNLNTSERKRKRIQLFFRMGVAYCISYVETDDDDDVDIEVDVLDMVAESYIGRTTFPRGAGFFSKLSCTNLLDWNGLLSFAQVVKDELHVLVLDDYRKLKWAETKRIIKLPFLKPDNKELLTCYVRARTATDSILFFVRQDKKTLCEYFIKTGKYMTATKYCDIDSVEEVAKEAAFIKFFYMGAKY